MFTIANSNKMINGYKLLKLWFWSWVMVLLQMMSEYVFIQDFIFDQFECFLGIFCV